LEYGKDNKFGNPNKGVLERLEKIETTIYRTDKMGEIVLKINKKGKLNVKMKIKE